MTSNSDDGADEVKVFRRNDADDVETAQSSHQLTEDKKDVALETELETRAPSASVIGSKAGAFVKPSPSFAPLPNTLSPTYAHLGFLYPLLLQNQAYMPFTRMPANMDPRYSPSYAFMMHHAAAQLSPNCDMYRNFSFPTHPQFQTNAATKAFANTMVRNMAMTPSGHPLNSINQMRLPQVGTTMTSMANSLAQASSSTSLQKKLKANENSYAKEHHIKKPLNAFMWYMKENRPKLMEEMEYKERQSAELNKELGRRWHDLPKEEQQRYYDMAKDDRERHMQKYPGWSARENYAIHKKKKRKRDKSIESGELKKCRARFGLSNQDQWCKHCKRKKRCLWYREVNSPSGIVSSTTPGTPGTPSPLIRPGIGLMSRRDSESDGEVIDEKPGCAMLHQEM